MSSCASVTAEVKEIPFLKLPISKLPPDFFPMTCRTCVEYTNVLADITVGYMGGQGEQWLLVRNSRGEELLDLLGSEVRISKPGSAGKARRAGQGLSEKRRARCRRPTGTQYAEVAEANHGVADADGSDHAGLNSREPASK